MEWFSYGFPDGLEVKNLPAMQKTLESWGLIPEWRRLPGGGNGKPLQYSCLDRIPWTEDPGGQQSKKVILSNSLEKIQRDNEMIWIFEPANSWLHSQGYHLCGSIYNLYWHNCCQMHRILGLKIQKYWHLTFCLAQVNHWWRSCLSIPTVYARKLILHLTVNMIITVFTYSHVVLWETIYLWMDYCSRACLMGMCAEWRSPGA